MRIPQLITAAGVAAAIAVSGCQTVDPYTGEEKTASATTGAIIGAIAGAALGAATGKNAKDRRKRALIGAGVGGLTGAAVGGYMDRQEAKLREKLQNTGVSVTRNGDNITLNMPGDITFQTAKSDLNLEFNKVLNGVAIVLEEFDQTLVVITGHADSVGAEDMNQALSERRAATVGNYLRTKGVNGDRILTEGFGETRPIASNDTPEGRARNRRVEVTLEPITQS